MHWRSIAPFCRGEDLQTDPTIPLRATSRHSGLTKVPITESHGRARLESPKYILSHSAAPRCVHALARKRGPRGRELGQRTGSPLPRGRTELRGDPNSAHLELLRPKLPRLLEIEGARHPEAECELVG